MLSLLCSAKTHTAVYIQQDDLRPRKTQGDRTLMSKIIALVKRNGQPINSGFKRGMNVQISAKRDGLISFCSVQEKCWIKCSSFAFLFVSFRQICSFDLFFTEFSYFNCVVKKMVVCLCMSAYLKGPPLSSPPDMNLFYSSLSKKISGSFPPSLTV